MGSKLPLVGPAASPKYWPHVAYYAMAGCWRSLRQGDLRRTVVVTGSPRSGTTWLGDVVSGLTGWPLYHEPTRTDRVPRMRDLHGWTGRIHRDPDTADPALAADLERIVTATYLGPGIIRRSRRMDANLWARRPFVTKLTDTNLLAPWMATQMPWLRMIQVVRHPLEVVASQESVNGSTWSEQRHLANPYRRFIEAHPRYQAPTEFETSAECQVTTWAIEHAWLRDNAKRLDAVMQVRYEDLRSDLLGQGTRICGHLGLDRPTAEQVAPLDRASRSVNRRVSTLGSASDSGWRSRYPADQRERLLAILARYDFPFYGPETMADVEATMAER